MAFENVKEISWKMALRHRNPEKKIHPGKTLVKTKSKWRWKPRKEHEGKSMKGFLKCPRPDLNWHRDLTPQRILSPVRLPIPPLGHFNRRQKVKKVEARGGIEPPISVLQTDALPLCYRALTLVKFKAVREQCWFQLIGYREAPKL